MNSNTIKEDVDFQTKAQCIASTVSSQNPTEALAKSLTCDRPTIDSAIKSYMSLCAARSMSSCSSIDSSTPGIPLHDDIDNNTKCYFKKNNPQKSSLQCARSLLKAINSFIVPTKNTNYERSNQEGKDDNDEERLEFEVVRILWNGLVNNGNKPSMILGQKSLSYVFPLIKESCFHIMEKDGGDNNDSGQDVDDSTRGTVFYPKDVDIDEAKSFINEFGTLLIDAEKRKNKSISLVTKNDDGNILNREDDDSCLLWDLDGGKAELERRRKRRELKSFCVRKDENKEDSSSQPGVTIEEIE